MARYFTKDTLSWEASTVLGGTVMNKSVVWEGDHDTRSAFFRMPKGMSIPTHTHPKWVQVMVLQGEMEVKADKEMEILNKNFNAMIDKLESGDVILPERIE